MTRRILPEKSLLFICDVQDRFRDLIYNFSNVVCISQMLKGFANNMQIPIAVTEQYPKALGHTVPELEITSKNVGILAEKKVFSMIVPPVEEFLKAHAERNVAIVVGLEAHVCVQQTVLDLLDRGYEVHLCCDGVSSQRPYDRKIALKRMASVGATLTTAESVMFEIMRSADHPTFKQNSTWVRFPRPDSTF
jgi:isochorismate hydrolase